MRARRFALIVALVAGSLSAPLTAFGQEEAHPTFVAEMTGFEEVPGAATLAKGFAGFQVSMDGNTVYYTITVTDASTPLMAAHLHLAPRGEAGSIVPHFKISFVDNLPTHACHATTSSDATLCS